MANARGSPSARFVSSAREAEGISDGLASSIPSALEQAMQMFGLCRRSLSAADTGWPQHLQIAEFIYAQYSRILLFGAINARSGHFVKGIESVRPILSFGTSEFSF